MDSQKLKALVVLNRKCTVSSNSLNEMFSMCRDTEPSLNLKDDIRFNKGLVEMFGKTDDIIPNIDRIENPTGFGGVIHSETLDSLNEETEEVVSTISKSEDIVVRQETQQESNSKKEYVEVSGFEIL